MSKRFIDTEIWDKDKFCSSTEKQKLLTLFITTKCDQIGVFKMANMLTSAYIGSTVTEEDILSIPVDIERIGDNKYWLVKFCKFQYGELSEECKPHLKYLKMLKEEGLIDRVDKGQPNHIKAVRKRLTQKIKDSILLRDKHTCQYCGDSSSSMVVDHINPISKGGDNSDDNLITSCIDCNSKKSDLCLVDFYDKFKSIKNLDRVYKILNTLEEKEKEKEQEEEEKEEEKETKIKNKIFIEPTVEEVKKYCIERKNSVDANHFLDHYIARDWILGNGRKVKCWKACVRTWEKNNFSGSSVATPNDNFDRLEGLKW